MATTVPNLYDLSNTGPRRQGQTRRNNFESLHGHRANSLRFEEKKVEKAWERDEDINALPQDSSDEREAPVFQAEGYGEASDNSEFEVVKIGKPRSSQRQPAAPTETIEKGTGTGSVKVYTFDGGSSQRIEPYRSSQKRKSEHMSDDDSIVNMSFEMSQSKKHRKSISYGKSKAKSRNIHEGPPLEEKNRARKRGSSQAEDGKFNFKMPPTDGLFAELDKQAKASPPSQSSSKPSTVAHGNRRSTTSSSKPGLKAPVFKAPKLPILPPEALKADPTFKRPVELASDEILTRAKRSSQRKTKPLLPNSNRSNVGAVNDSAAIAADMLGLEDVTFKVPSSALTASSPAERSSSSCGFSSPPTSLIDDTIPIQLTTIPLEQEHSEIFSKEKPVSESSQSPKCPLCKAPVDSLFLEGFAGNRRMTIREQAKFCQAHKRRTAEEEWQMKGYPEIDWPFLHMQVKIHSEAIDKILRGERFSYYRNAYDDYLKREKHRTLQQSLVKGGGIEDFSPGYYGSRGARIMIDNLMSNFALKLRRRSAIDSLISSRGVTNYVQAVLVPELATLLVMDDLKVDAEKAREVLRDSVELGNFLNEEEDEMIKDPEMNDTA